VNWKKHRFPLSLATAALSLGCAGWLIAAEKGAPQRPYAPDEHTPFLHHLDGDTGNLEHRLARRQAHPPRFPTRECAAVLVWSDGVMGQWGNGVMEYWEIGRRRV